LNQASIADKLEEPVRIIFATFKAMVPKINAPTAL
jgi:hypothetical protein